RIFVNMGPGDLALVGIDEPEMQAVAAAIAASGRMRLRTVSVGGSPEADLFVDADGALFDDGIALASFAAMPTLRGTHNWQNAAMALAAAEALGIDRDVALAAMQDFPGLAHRMELVGRRGKVL